MELTVAAARLAPADSSLIQVLEVRGLQVKRVCGGRAETIVSAINLSVAAGETVGIVGESGSGKWITAQASLGYCRRPSSLGRGHVRRSQPARPARAALTQGSRPTDRADSARPLHDAQPRAPLRFAQSTSPLRGQRQQRMTRRERRAEVLRRLAEVGIYDETVADRYPFQLSGGMRQRIAIAAALAREPGRLIAHEPSTALDVTTQREILALIKSLQDACGMGLILITHDLRVVFGMCDRIYVLYAGSLVEIAPAAELDAEPLHPYSHGLLLPEPPADRRVNELIAIPGEVPKAADVSDRCVFAPRCQWARPICSEGAPPLLEVGPQRLSACIRLAEIRAEMASAARACRTRRSPTDTHATNSTRRWSASPALARPEAIALHPVSALRPERPLQPWQKTT